MHMLRLTDCGAATEWRESALLERFGDRTFSITAPYGRVKMTMRDYLDFSARQCDEVPLYLFDAYVSTLLHIARLRNEYKSFFCRC